MTKTFGRLAWPALMLAALAAPLPAAAQAAPAQAGTWQVGSCFDKAGVAAEASKPGMEYGAGLEPEVSPGVELATKNTDTESPFFDKTLEWEMGQFAQMMNPERFAAMTQEHASRSGESAAQAHDAMVNMREALWSDLRTSGIRLRVAVVVREKATGHGAKLLSDAVPASGEPTKFCVVAVQ